MKPSAAFITIQLLLLFLLLPQSYGMRMGKRLTFFQEEAQQMDQVVEAQNSNSADIDDGHEGVHFSCENTQCEGKKRKLLITATATTSSSSSSSKGHGKAEFSASSSTTEFEGYHDDVIDIAEMDYSPAKRKPPIHN